MRNSLLIVIALAWSNRTCAQSCLGFEQYVYADKKGMQAFVPVVYAQGEHGWYAESHLNYEQLHTFSIYMGKTFSENRKFSYSITPMMGGVVGSLNGGVLGLNSSMNFKKLFFTSQSQYVFSFQNKNVDFLFSWLELGCQIFTQAMVGLSVQHSMLNPTDSRLDTGCFVRFSIRQWSFPVYCFDATTEKRYMIFGVAREFKFLRNKGRGVPSAN